VSLHPSTRTTAALLVCVLAASAGCSGVGPFGGAAPSPSSTRTPAPVPSDGGYPPGVSVSGIEDREALLSAHETTLAGRNYTVTSRSRVRFPNGTTYRRSEIRRRVAANDVRYLTVRFRGIGVGGSTASPAVRLEQWTNDSLSLRRWEYANGSVRYERSPAYGPVSPGTSWLETRFDGTAVRVQRRSDEVVLTHRQEFRAFVPGEPRGAAALRAVVRTDGRVRSTRVRAPVHLDGANATAVFRTGVSNVGETTVGTPRWFHEAVARTRSASDTGSVTRTATPAA
jgi:hypothetical protein